MWRTWSAIDKSSRTKIPEWALSKPRRPGELPLIARYPALAGLARVALGDFPSPVSRLGAISPSLWIKRDDLCADPLGGNKTRALEFLLGGVERGDTVVTVGSAGSTHALAVATHAKPLCARVMVGRW